ncbi:MAG: hypothetical protein KJ709_07275 [Nanoarchaeota archaeon]|nr:hypothetical protein [Nanoarchaeota archaeon]
MNLVMANAFFSDGHPDRARQFLESFGDNASYLKPHDLVRFDEEYRAVCRAYRKSDLDVVSFKNAMRTISKGI